jgi:hypothetical protein
MPTTCEAERQGASWRIKAGVFNGEKPKWAGFRNVAVLARRGDGALTLDTGYSLPGAAWCTLMVIAVALLTGSAVLLKGQPVSSLAADGVIGVFAVYMFMLWSRQHALNLELPAAASDVLVDEARCRIALQTQIGERTSWIVLSEFKGRFSEAAAAVRDVMGGKCRPGQIAEGNWLPLVVVVAISIVCFFVLWCRGPVCLE